VDSGSCGGLEAALFDRKGSRKYLNAVERKAFQGATRKIPDHADRAFCLVLFYCGCRISEGLNVLVERVDLSARALTFETMKRRERGHFRSVPIPDCLIETLRKLINGRSPDERVWTFSRPTAYRLIKNVMQIAAISGAMGSPKGLRHGFAIACIEQKIPLTTIKKWLGHSRLETTAIYLDVMENEERQLAQRLWS
jgi:integrase/recombinase XerD